MLIFNPTRPVDLILGQKDTLSEDCQLSILGCTVDILRADASMNYVSLMEGFDALRDIIERIPAKFFCVCTMTRSNDVMDWPVLEHVIDDKEMMALVLESFNEVDIVVTGDFSQDD